MRCTCDTGKGDPRVPQARGSVNAIALVHGEPSFKTVLFNLRSADPGGSRLCLSGPQERTMINQK